MGCELHVRTTPTDKEIHHVGYYVFINLSASLPELLAHVFQKGKQSARFSPLLHLPFDKGAQLKQRVGLVRDHLPSPHQTSNVQHQHKDHQTAQ
jgi:hypothetical protein